MARTIRRKQAKHEYYWVLHDYVQCSSGYFVRIQVDPRSAEGRKRLCKFHSDGASTMEMVPASFRRILNRKRRRADVQALHVFSLVGNLEDGPVMRPRRSDVRWLWW